MSKQIKHNNTFNEGLSSDINDLSQSNKVYTDAENVVLIPREDEDFILQNIKGNKLEATLPEGHIARAVKVFNGIAYIVSSKYNEDQEYEYTEIGTYPSPDWDTLLPERQYGNVDDINQGEVIDANSVSLVNELGSISSDIDFEEVWDIRFDSMKFSYSDTDAYIPVTGFDPQRDSYSVNGFGYYSNLSSTYNLVYYDLAFRALPLSNLYNELINYPNLNSKGRLEVDILRFEKNSNSGWSLSNKSMYGLFFRRITESIFDRRKGYLNPDKTFSELFAAEDVIVLDDAEDEAEGGLNFSGRLLSALEGLSRSYNGVESLPGHDTPHNISNYEGQDIMIRFVIKSNEELIFRSGDADEGFAFRVYSYYDGDGTDAWKLPSFGSNGVFDNMYSTSLNGRFRSFDRNSVNLNTTDVPELFWQNEKSLLDTTYSYVGGSAPRLIYKKINYIINNVSLPVCGFNGDYAGGGASYTSLRAFPSYDSGGIIYAANYDGVKLRKKTFISGDILETNILQTGNDRAITLIKIPSQDSVNVTVELFGQNPSNSLLLPSDYLETLNYLVPNTSDSYEFIAKNIFGSNIFSPNYSPLFFNGPLYINKYINYAQKDFVLARKKWTAVNDWDLEQDYTSSSLTKEKIRPWTIDAPFIEIYGTNEATRILLKNNYYTPFFNEFDDVNMSLIDGIGNVISTSECIGVGGSNNLNIQFDGCANNQESIVFLSLSITSSIAGSLSLASEYLYGNSILKTFTAGETIDFELLFINVDTNEINLNLRSNTDGLLDNLNFSYDKFYYNCMSDCNSGVVNEYHPLINFNNTDSSEIELMNSNNYKDPFRTDKLIKDSEDGLDLELQPSYDNTINLIINDKKTKVKLINSRFAYNPSNKIFSIPQNSGYNDNNVYSNEHPNRMELLLRSKKVLNVDLNSVSKGGQVPSGSYIFYFRYVDSDGNTTDIEAHSLKTLAVMFNGDIIYGAKPGENTNSKFSFKLSNIDHSFTHIKVSYMLSTGELNAENFYYELQDNISISLNDSVMFEFTGLETVKSINHSELIKSYNHHKSVFSLEQSKNILALGNINLPDIDMYEKVQQLATKYLRIKEGDFTSTESFFYKNPLNNYNKVGYWRGETYQLGTVLPLTSGGTSPVFYPRGIDNITGNAVTETSDEYTSDSIDDFSGQYGENPYGIYRTSLDTPIMEKQLNSEDNFNESELKHIIYLRIEGLEDFYNEVDILFPNLFKGATIVRTERLKDVVSQGYITSVFKMPFAPGIVAEANQDGDDNVIAYDYDNEGIDSSGPLFIDSDLSDSVIRKNTGSMYMAPFRMIQLYDSENFGDEYRPHNVPIFSNNAAQTTPYGIMLSNKLLRTKSDSNRFAFLTGDLNVDAEHFAAEFNGGKKFYHVSQNPTYFFNGWYNYDSLIGVRRYINASTNFNMLRHNGPVNNRSKIISGYTESYYIPEESMTNTDNFFSSKIDKTNINHKTCAYIGCKEYSGLSDSNINQLIYNYNQKESPLGFLSNVYNQEGPLNNQDWKVVYKNTRYSNNFFPITHVMSRDSISNDINCFNGDCYVSKANVRLIYKNGLENNFDNYSDIWDYVGEVGSRDYMHRNFDLGRKDNDGDDPAAESWFTDSTYTMLQRARLVPKGLWASMYHESNYNLELRSDEFKNNTEKAIYGKDRSWLKHTDLKYSYVEQEIKSSQLETKGYNKGYSNNNGALGFYAVNDYEKILREFYSRIEASAISIKNALRNGYREFYGLNYKDYDTKYGSIQKLIENNNNLYCISERATSVVPLFEKTMSSEEAGGVFTEQKDVLGKTLTILSDKYGTIHPNSVISTLTGLYYFDYNNICIMNISSGGVVDISSYKIERFLYAFMNYFKGLESGYKIDVRSNYNNITGDVIFTFYILEDVNSEVDSCSLIENNDYDLYNGNIPTEIVEYNNTPESERKVKIDHSVSIYYNERLKKWVSRLSYDPMFQFNLAKDSYSFNLLDNCNRIYKHDSNEVNYCYFYDSQDTFSFEFIINNESYVQKILDNFLVVSNRQIPIFIDYKTDPKFNIDTLEEYDLDSRQNPLARRHEVSIIGIPKNSNYYLNVLNRDNSDLISNTFLINGVDFRVINIQVDATLVGTQYEGMSIVEIEYNDGSGWDILDNNSDYYDYVFGFNLKIDKINITRSSADYVEDILYMQVLQSNSLDIRDKIIKVRMEYDGIDHTYVHAVISSLRMSLN